MNRLNEWVFWQILTALKVTTQKYSQPRPGQKGVFFLGVYGLGALLIGEHCKRHYRNLQIQYNIYLHGASEPALSASNDSQTDSTSWIASCLDFFRSSYWLVRANKSPFAASRACFTLSLSLYHVKSPILLRIANNRQRIAEASLWFEICGGHGYGFENWGSWVLKVQQMEACST